MSSEALHVIEQIQAVLVGHDVVAALEGPESDRVVLPIMRRLTEPDFAVAMIGPDYLPARQEASGLEGFQEVWRDWTSPFAQFRIEVDEVIEAGDRVVTFVRQFGTTRTGGVEIETAGAAVWHVRAGRLHRVEFHLDRDAALRAAGLEDAQSSQA